MTDTTSKLPRETRPLKMDPDLARFLEQELEPYTGAALAKAQAAVVRVRSSGTAGTWDQLTGRYREAIQAAVRAKA